MTEAIDINDLTKPLAERITQAVSNIRLNLRTFNPSVLEDLDFLLEHASFDDDGPQGDADALTELLAHATWEPDGGSERAYFTTGVLEEAFGWECGSCRPDVGWCKWATAERDSPSDPVTLVFECGHCGTYWSYDAVTGEPVDNNYF